MRAVDNTDEWPSRLLGGAIPCVSVAGHQWCRGETRTDEERSSDDDGGWLGGGEAWGDGGRRDLKDGGTQEGSSLNDRGLRPLCC
jgi:hypothetical protein